MTNHRYEPPPRRPAVTAGILTFLYVSLCWVWQGASGFNVWDESFLWYGVQRSILGEVPIRDFMAYDPGRYYFAAGALKVWGNDGILALRATLALFQCFGLFAGLYVLAMRARPGVTFLAAAALILVIWMVPRHKLFDISLSIFLVTMLTWLLTAPLVRRHFVVGVCIGVVAVFGRNHGVYGVVAYLAIVVWLALGGDTHKVGRSLLLWLCGVVIGYLPVLLMCALVPGFVQAFWQSIRFLFEVQATNLPLPVPWPWRANFSAPFVVTIQQVLTGCIFLGLPAFGVLASGWAFIRRLRGLRVEPELLAASVLAIPYAHFAFSRADVSHLAQGAFPTLIGVLALLARCRPWLRLPLVVLCVGVSAWVMHGMHPGWQCSGGVGCEQVAVAGDLLVVPTATAADIRRFEQIAAKYAPEEEAILAVPFPGVYALLERRAPIWEIYPLFPRDADFERVEIARLERAKPVVAIILEHKLDGRDALLFRNSHPLLYEHIMRNFDAVEGNPTATLKIYTAKPLPTEVVQ